ncbi:uncharacterized protein N0V89_011242 [Didymosphaeria variabile]|uniref:Uncharacterized protein n=1 Tax=Didymosphaeria variabile TaxID=1932322 RepID=A0A9W9C7V6_9PLEO|nr:uncharacterized protein N0V89_011242 [Didymosphaeria variabile]KAJ4347302.1 hypothetical protein N0V89_011242 [Didymosphaeria variabile]
MEDRPHLSITLPRNFMFHYQDGQPPRTPEPEAQLEEMQPPPPPRQVLKVRRRRTTFVPTQIFNDPDDGMPIPTIEGPELHSDASAELPTFQPDVDNEYLSPALTWSRMLSPPKTPVSQMGSLSSFDGLQHWSEMDQASQSETSSRPTSSSGFSDSSRSSFDSFDSFPSLGGSCTSSEDEKMDPFIFCSPATKHTPMLSSPLVTQQRQQAKLKLKATFTEEMDYHLWMTYMKYLQDPTVTPFKALPTTMPPNGVCHRVARLARHTWKGPRKSPTASGVRFASRVVSRSGTPDTIRPAKSGSSTPVPGANKPYARFPAEKQVRRRLRYLAKQKPTLSAHYQRLMHRSPSPLQSSPPPEPCRPGVLSSPFSQPAPSFSTRDMNISLATSTAPSMQAGNPLAQLATSKTPRPAEVERAHMRASAHQKSQSLHIGLGLGLSNVFGSSLDSNPQSNDVVMTQPSARTWHAASARPPKLGSPVQLHAPRPMSRAFKRRALHSFEDQTRNRGNSFISQVFGAPAESSHRRVRSRGFSLGDMVEGSRRLPLSTSGPAGFNPFANPPVATQQLSPVSPAEVQGRATIRLGSPFGGRPSNTFPRASTSHGFELPTSFEQRFAALPSDPATLHRY